jgi:hypothetical protein
MPHGAPARVPDRQLWNGDHRRLELDRNDHHPIFDLRLHN